MLIRMSITNSLFALQIVNFLFYFIKVLQTRTFVATISCNIYITTLKHSLKDFHEVTEYATSCKNLQEIAVFICYFWVIQFSWNCFKDWIEKPQIHSVCVSIKFNQWNVWVWFLFLIVITTYILWWSWLSENKDACDLIGPCRLQD